MLYIIKVVKTITLALVIMFSLNSCKKKEVALLETSSITSISASSAVGGGNITDDRGETITKRGVCYSKNLNPSIKDLATSDGAGAGTFLSPVTNLEPATDYYIRAYATNSSGTGYGMVMSFRTLGDAPVSSTLAATNITTTTATLSATINANYLSTSVTFEYGTSITYGNIAVPQQSPVTGSTGLIVSAGITGLTEGTTYHYRVKAVNSLGTTYGDDVIFTTLGQAPTATTLAATNLTANSATVSATVNANYLLTTITFEYGTSVSYGSTINAASSPVSGFTPVTVTAVLSSLTTGVTYHYRVKALNSLGTTYGNDMTFIPSGPAPVSDIEGNLYTTVQIGSQVWMAENLRTTKYNDNTSIPNIIVPSDWILLTTPAYRWYNDAVTNKSTFGGFYNWYTVNTGKLCPTGWHVPTDNDFTIFTDFLGGLSVAGGKIKEAGLLHWASPNTGATNESGFTALASGHIDDAGNFGGITLSAPWWSSTMSGKPYYRSVGSTISSVSRSNGAFPQRGFGIRCVKD